MQKPTTNIRTLVRSVILFCLLFPLARTVTAQQPCGADIYILNDNSGSVDATEYRQSKQFVTALATRMAPLGTAQTETRIAIGDFSGTGAYKQYDFPFSTNNYTIQMADIVSYENAGRPFIGNTDVGYALNAASVQAGLPVIPGRSTAQILIVLTDAYTHQIPASIVNTANQLKSQGFYIMVMALNDAIASTYLPDVASPGGYFTSSTYQELQNLVIAKTQSVAEAVCTFAPPTPKPDLTISLSNFTVTNCNVSPNYNVNYTVNNTGDTAFSGNLTISLYNNTPAIPGTIFLGTYNAGSVNITAGGSTTGSISNTNVPLLNSAQSLYALVNFDGAAAGNQVPVAMPLPHSKLLVEPEKLTENNLSAMTGLSFGAGCDNAILNVAVTSQGGACDEEVTYTVEICNSGSQAANISSILPNAATGFVLTNSTAPACTIGNAPTQMGQNIYGQYSNSYSGDGSTDLSADGNTLAMGQRGFSGSSENVNIYSWNGTSWLQKGNVIPRQKAGEAFGSAVRLTASGNTVLIGAYINNTLVGQGGAAYVFDLVGSTWTLRGTPIYGTINGERIGQGETGVTTMDITNDGKTIVLGSNASGNTEPGFVRVFDWNGTAWVQRGATLYGANQNSDKFAVPSIADNGNDIVIGAFEENYGALTKSGAVRAYHWDGTSWVQRGSTIGGTTANLNLGVSIEIIAVR